MQPVLLVTRLHCCHKNCRVTIEQTSPAEQLESRCSYEHHPERSPDELRIEGAW
jgi:hypothetical protein